MTTPVPVFEVAEEVFARWPSYVVGCIQFLAVDNRRVYPVVDAALEDAESAFRSLLADREVKELSGIAKWRSVFAEAGWTPSKYPASIEAIAKRVARGQALPRINPVVDLVNAVSLRTQCPIGAHDIASLRGQTLTVRFARDGDIFLPMGDEPPESPDPSEVVYASGCDVRTRRWVWRQARNALITNEVTDLFFPIDGFSPETVADVRRAVDLLSVMGSEIFVCKVSTGFVDRNSNSFLPESAPTD